MKRASALSVDLLPNDVPTLKDLRVVEAGISKYLARRNAHLCDVDPNFKSLSKKRRRYGYDRDTKWLDELKLRHAMRA